MQLKTTRGYHNTIIRIVKMKKMVLRSAGVDLEQLSLSHIAGRSIN